MQKRVGNLQAQARVICFKEFFIMIKLRINLRFQSTSQRRVQFARFWISHINEEKFICDSLLIARENVTMTVNHGGSLKKEYFLSYLNLIKTTRNCTLEQAKNLTLELFFHNDINQYGKETYNRFLDAYHDLQTR
jgi:hypothetical protein